MGLKIRLARGGSKKRPYYRIVVADERAPRDGRYIERVGFYNPMVAKTHPDRVKLLDERVKYWLGEGAKPTDRVLRFLSAVNLVNDRKIPVQDKKSLQSERTIIKLKEKAEKLVAKQSEAEKAVKAKAEAEKAEAEKAEAEKAVKAKAEAAKAAVESKTEESSSEEVKSTEEKVAE